MGITQYQSRDLYESADPFLMYVGKFPWDYTSVISTCRIEYGPVSLVMLKLDAVKLDDIIAQEDKHGIMG